MGLVGGPHCVAMCGAACAGIGQAAAPRTVLALWMFQIGRVVGYSILGALAAASLQSLGWLTVQSAALRPVWSLFHVAALALGLVLLFQARQPVWLESFGRQIWQRTKAFASQGGRVAPFMLGAIWALLPCGLLYSALMVAALAGSPEGGAMVMGLFVTGTSVTMVAGPWLWLRLNKTQSLGSAGQWGVRLAGGALAVSSAWALWMALAHNAAPWCATP